MNFLPFITILLFVLSLCSMGFFQSYKTTSQASSSFVSYMDTSTFLRGKIESDLFVQSKEKGKSSPKRRASKKQKKEKETTAEMVRNGHDNVTCLTNLRGKKGSVDTVSKKRSAREHKKYITFRTRKLTENSKLNIASLFKKKDALLEKTLLDLIESLYQDTPLLRGGKGANSQSALIVKELVKAGKEMRFEDLTLNRIRLEDPDLQDIWHKMLKGTRSYNLDKKEGIPRLSDYVIICKDLSRLPICSKKASIPVLNAFFGTEFTQSILHAEQEKFYAEPDKKSPLTEEEIKELIKKAGLFDTTNYLMYNYKEKVREVVSAIHEDTGVISERVVYENLKKTEQGKETKKS